MTGVEILLAFVVGFAAIGGYLVETRRFTQDRSAGERLTSLEWRASRTEDRLDKLEQDGWR